MVASVSHSKRTKSFIKKCVFNFCYIFFSQKAVNNSLFVFPACQTTVFVLQQRKNEHIVVQIWPFASSKNKSKQTFCDSVV